MQLYTVANISNEALFHSRKADSQYVILSCILISLPHPFFTNNKTCCMNKKIIWKKIKTKNVFHMKVYSYFAGFRLSSLQTL